MLRLASRAAVGGLRAGIAPARTVAGGLASVGADLRAALPGADALRRSAFAPPRAFATLADLAQQSAEAKDDGTAAASTRRLPPVVAENVMTAEKLAATVPNVVTTPTIFAIIDVKGTQFKVVPDDVILANKMEVEVGEHIQIERVLMVGSKEFTAIGQPVVKTARVHAVVEEQRQGAKVYSFRKKRRKGHERLRGFRAQITILRILGIEFPQPPAA
eukprot:tig00001371_g8421.t1